MLSAKAYNDITFVAAFIMAMWKKRMMNMSLWRPD